MGPTRLRACLAGFGLIVSEALAMPAAARAQEPAAAAAPGPTVTDPDTVLENAAAHARLVAAHLDSVAAAQAGQRLEDKSATQYQNGLYQFFQGEFQAAYLLLRSAVATSPNSARNHGDLALTLTCLRRWEDAATEYTTAISLQPANPWYYVGLGMVRSIQEQWPDAAANFTRAMATDSSILTQDLLVAASSAFEQSGQTGELLAWARLGTRRFPNEAWTWLQTAMMLRRRGDTAEGLAAIRRFHALRPDNLLGDALFSLYLSDIGEGDSAVAFAALAATDSSYREYASLVYLRVGARLLQAKQYEHAAYVLAEGRPMASPATRARYSLYLAHANLQRLTPMYAEAVQKKDCHQGRLVDSLLVSVQHDLRESVALDSVQTTHILTEVLPQVQTWVNEFLATCPKR
jgi:tetratricopeptide (TPR) repeat protein